MPNPTTIATPAPGAVVIPITDISQPSQPAQLTGPPGQAVTHTAPVQGVPGVDAPLPAETPAAEAAKLLAGKYKTPEDLAKGIQEVLKGKSTEQQEAMYLAMLKSTQAKAEEGAKPEAEAAPAAAAEAPAPGKTLPTDRLMELADEVLAKGSLSEETKRSIRALGYTNEQIDSRVSEFQQAVEVNNLRAALVLGGEQELGQAKEWLGKQSKSLQKLINLGLLSSNKEDVDVAAQLLRQQMATSPASEPKMQFGRRMPPNQGTQPFANQAEKHAIQMSRAYQDSSHPAYAQVHKEFDERLKLTLELNPGAL